MKPPLLAFAALMATGAMPARIAAQEPAQSQPQPEAAKVDPNAPSPDQSYIFFRTSRRMGLLFLRQPTAAEEDQARAETMVPIQERYQKELAEWRRVEESCQRDSTAARCRNARPAPAEPTPESAAYGLDPERNIAIVYRSPTFTDDDGGFTFLEPLRPGTYVLYGQRDNSATGWAGICLCMGSLSFEVGPGQVVDLGTITYPGLEATHARPSVNSAVTETGQPSIVIVPPGTGAPLPPGLAGVTVVPARFNAAGKMANFMHLYIDRHPALPGILGYERDRVIDERTGTDPAPAAH